MDAFLDDHTHCKSCIRADCSHPDGCPIVPCPQTCGANFHWCKTKQHQRVCANEKTACINVGNGCPHEVPRRDMASHLKSCPANVVYCPRESCQITNEDCEKGVSDEKNRDQPREELSMTAPEVIQRKAADQQSTPHKVYGFLNSQVFRRDEYRSHAKIFHSEINSGLCDWLEQRCPLNEYGCPFVVRRMRPDADGSRLIFNPLLNNYAVRLGGPGEFQENEITNGNGSQEEAHSLADLPQEVLEYIATYLDSFSLCNLALTNKQLRQACYTMLPYRGVVVPQWQRQTVDDKVHWSVEKHMWLFTSHPEESSFRWHFDDAVFQLSEHLKNCKFYDPLVRTEKVMVMNYS